jgi:hypothetical protein
MENESGLSMPIVVNVNTNRFPWLILLTNTCFIGKDKLRFFIFPSSLFFEVFMKGSISIEASFVLPVFFLLFVLLFDVGTVLNNYLEFTQIIREGTQHLERTPELVAGQYVSNESTPIEHENIHERIYFLTELQNMQGVNNIEITTSLNDDQVFVELSADIATILGSSYKLRLKETGSYLF